MRRIKGKNVYVHRLTFFEAYGWWPAQVLHHCDNPPCHELAHLFDGDNAINVDDMTTKGRCSRKLTDTEVVEIRQLYGESRGPGRGKSGTGGYTQTELALMFGVTQGTVSNVIRRKGWRHL